MTTPIGRLISATTAALPRLSPGARDAWAKQPRTRAVHEDALATIDAFQAVEVGGDATLAALPRRLTAVAWNLERCFEPAASAARIEAACGGAPLLALLSELDCGMARTAQRHTAAELAERLGLAYAYGVEFLELGLGGRIERAFATDAENAAGFHGNALLSAAPARAVHLLRFQEDGLWWTETDRGEARFGARMALIAELPWDGPGGALFAVSTHFESHSGPAPRTAQMRAVLDAVETLSIGRDPAPPVILGGDLNTGVRSPTRDWREEPLFALGEDAGFAWENGGPGFTTRTSRLSIQPNPGYTLDWIALRGLRATDARIEPALTPAGRPLSDHELVAVTAE